MNKRSGWKAQGSFYSLILSQTFRLQVLIICLGLAIPPLAVVPLHMQEQLIDVAIPEADLGLVYWLMGLYAAAVLARLALKSAVMYLRGWISEIVARTLRASLVDAQRQRSEDRARSSLGTVTSVITAEVDPLGSFASEALNTPLIQGGTLLSVFGYMFVTEASLAAIGLSALVLEAIITPIVQRRINRLTKRRVKTLRKVGGEMIEAADDEHHEQIVDGLHNIRLTYLLRLRMNVLKVGLKIARNVIDHFADIAVLLLGASMAIAGEVEIGVIVAFLSGLKQVRQPWAELVSFYRRLADARVKFKLVQAGLNNNFDANAAA